MSNKWKEIFETSKQDYFTTNVAMIILLSVKGIFPEFYMILLTVLTFGAVHTVVFMKEEHKIKSKQAIYLPTLFIIYIFIISVVEIFYSSIRIYNQDTLLLFIGVSASSMLIASHETLKESKTFKEMDFLIWICITLYTLSLSLPMSDFYENIATKYINENNWKFAPFLYLISFGVISSIVVHIKGSNDKGREVAFACLMAIYVLIFVIGIYYLDGYIRSFDNLYLTYITTTVLIMLYLAGYGWNKMMDEYNKQDQ